METLLPQAPGKRIEYIDALRGFTMILVVLCHVAYSCLGIDENTPSFHRYLVQVRMPMFFFISGFVLYKAGVVWTLNHIGGFLRKKFVVQILSSLFFFTLFVHFSNKNFYNGFVDVSKYGYWFTYTLFIYYIFYALIRFLCKKYEDYVVIIVAAIFYVINWPPLYTIIPVPDNVKAILGIENWFYFCFFLLGTLFKKHFNAITCLLDKQKLLLFVSILMYFLLNIYQDILPSGGVVGVIIQFCKTITGIVIIFSFFRNKQDLFTKKKVLGRLLQYIGRRTLDIYLLHYFLLPHSLSNQYLVNF